MMTYHHTFEGTHDIMLGKSRNAYIEDIVQELSKKLDANITKN